MSRIFAALCLGLAGAWAPVWADIEGRVRLPSGAPVARAQVFLFDLSDIRAAPAVATTDPSGRFTLPLASLAGVLPERFELGANYPNPFNPSTMIPYQLPAAMHVRLEIYNLLGQRVATLVDREQPAGSYGVRWDATNAAGQAVGAGAYLYRLSGGGATVTRSMLLIDGQAGVRGPARPPAGPFGDGEVLKRPPAYGLTVSGPGLVPYVDPDFRVEAGGAPLEVVVEAPGPMPASKAVSSGGILGDVNNSGGVDLFDALLVAVYSRESSIVLPNNGDISLGDVNADGQVDLGDAALLIAHLFGISIWPLSSGIGEPVGPVAALSPGPSTVTLADDGVWHAFTVQARVPLSVVVNPDADTARLEITTLGDRGNDCPAEADDSVARRDGEAVFLAGCAAGEAMLELRRESDGTVLRTYTFEVAGRPDLVVESVSVDDTRLTAGQSFSLRAEVRNQGTAAAAATTLQYYRSSAPTISTGDTQVGTMAVGALGASRASAKRIILTAPSSEGTYYYGACVVSVAGESDTRNNCSPPVTLSVGRRFSLSSDREALVALYHATDGPNWTNSANWLSDKPLAEWHGVTVINDRVASLDLESNQLTGSMPSELGDLTNLESLVLGYNQLTGPIPPQLGQLSKLLQLYLPEAGLTGEVPHELGQLTSLEFLSLSANHLTGPIPSSWKKLTKLASLDLSWNQLTGEIPPELGQLTSLWSLYLQGNQLTGGIPSELGQLTNLSLLELWANQLTGEIPPAIGQLTNLQGLILGGNHLTGPIPPELGRLTKAEALWLGSNKLTGAIPPELGQLTSLSSLELLQNQLTGAIPPELGQLTKLERLFLDSNQLTGAIPPELGQLTQLTHLELAFNRLSGPLPAEFISLSLELFGLVGNQVCVPRAVEFEQWLRGIAYLSPYTHCRDPQWDALSALYNGTGGPNWRNKTNWLSLAPLGEWHGVTADEDGRVVDLNLEGNNLSGTVPLALGGLANLKTLNLALNASLSGPLPQTTTGLPLERLELQGTQVCAPPQAEFQAWLDGISLRTGLTSCTDTRVDYYVLVDLHNATDGPNWTNATNWATPAPLNEWYGVVADPSGRVTGLDLGNNNLRGPLSTVLRRLTHLEYLSFSANQLMGEVPAELGQLRSLRILSLSANQLTGGIPPELGQLTHLDHLTLSANQLTGEVPAELGQLGSLGILDLSANQLTGEIPPELGQLIHLTSLSLIDNQLTGEIPSELGQLLNLEFLFLARNQLTGEIPSELGQLTHLISLSLGVNQLTGEIPPALGQLSSLESLFLARNQLAGDIPSELGQLTRLSSLDLALNQLTGEIPFELGRIENLESLLLQSNQLTGAIPSELGQLTNLSGLDLSTNQLTGEIPPELGQMTNLSGLNLSTNQLQGNVPPELGDLGHLRTLDLAYNGALSGTLPLDLIRLSLENLRLQETLLCPPEDADFQRWLFGIPTVRATNCSRTDASAAYLTQAAQSLEYPVPLVAGEAALLRVFVTAAREVEATMPPVRATFYLDGAEVHTAEIRGQATRIPRQIHEGDLSGSANARVPGSVVRPGLEMVVEIDPARTLDPALGVCARLPPEGRTALNIRSMPPFHLTLVPFLWTEDPDSTVLAQTEGLTAESDLFRLTRDLLPVGEFRLAVHEPVWTSVDPTSDSDLTLSPEVGLIHALEGASGYHMGIFRSEGAGGLKGIAETPGFVSLSILDGNTIAHELGHNLSLGHSPGCGAGWPDPDYPYENGSIGVWGYDSLNERLVSPGTSDLMTYCNPQWISEYTFAQALGYRSASERPRLAAKYSSSSRGLLLWGGLGDSGELFLEPAFVVSAPPLPPQLDGPYRLTGEDEDGDGLFGLSFDMAEISCGRKGGRFAFILPAGTDWPDRLTRIVLSGPEGVSTLDGEEDPSAALLLDRSTGRVRGVLRDWPKPTGKPVAVRRAPPEPGLEVLTSRGLPDSASWVR